MGAAVQGIEEVISCIADLHSLLSSKTCMNDELFFSHQCTGERSNRKEVKGPNSSTVVGFFFGYELKQKAFNYNRTPPFLLGTHST